MGLHPRDHWRGSLLSECRNRDCFGSTADRTTAALRSKSEVIFQRNEVDCDRRDWRSNCIRDCRHTALGSTTCEYEARKRNQADDSRRVFEQSLILAEAGEEL